MCGIAGIIRFGTKKVERSEIKRLTDAIAHRGPDGEGCWIHQDGQIGLGHRRLSILDLSAQGAQPMHYADGLLTVVFNGEIFNFAELREELKLKGYFFQSDSDTEVLLAAYHAWGKDCLNRFNGFWAFALWDERIGELWIARDRFGIKPLYFYHDRGRQFAFGSETIQFKHLSGYERRADTHCVTVALQNPWMLEGTGKTIFSDILQVRPGHFLSIRSNGEIKEAQWWDTSAHVTTVPEDYEQQVRKFSELFEDAVRLRLRSDVSIGSALSGGLDSSAVYTTIHKLMRGQQDTYRLPADWQRAFVAVFPGTEQDERVYAEKVLAHTGGTGVFFDMMDTPYGLTDRLIQSVKDYDVVYSTPLLILDGVYGTMKANGVTVSMDGHGVDEMLYGYSYNVYEAFQYARQEKDEVYAADLLDTYMRMLPEPQRLQKEKEFRSPDESFLTRQIKRVRRKLQPAAQSEWWVDPALLQEFSSIPFQIPSSFKGSEAGLYQAFHYTALPTILRNFDLGAMRNGIEVRMPFLDYRLVSYVFSLPMKSKLGNGFTKRILRDAMKDVLPEEIRARKLKTGFNAPLLSWYKRDLKQFIRDELHSAAFRNSPYWNGKRILAFAEKKYKQNNWTEPECFRVWPFINAHILFNYKST